MPVAVLLALGAVAHERHVAPARQLPDEPQRELLAVVLDRPALPVDRSVEKQFLPVASPERRPGNFSAKEFSQQAFAWPEARNPHIVTRRRHTAAAKAGDEEPQAVALAVDGGPDRFGFQHSKCSTRPSYRA